MNEMSQNPKPRIVLLSDLWGTQNSDWVRYYTAILEQHFDTQFYDCCELGNVDKSNHSQENRHNQFLQGGIERAVEILLQIETETVDVLGLSIGGTIAWKACLSGLKVENLYAISSTRLRYETQKPMVKINLFYGENDENKPQNNWFELMEIPMKLFKNQAHEMYKKQEIAEEICQTIIENLKPKLYV